jgi:hypothetical protein
MVLYFTIMGERCSGTNFLENAIEKNFEIELIWHYGYKHFFGYYNYNNKNPIIDNDDDVLFLGIIREPISWIDSLYDKKHHIPDINKNDINKFLNNEFYSIDDNKNEIMQDRNYKNGARYKNIFEMRKYKNQYLINHNKRVKNYLLIRYEDLKNKYEGILMFLENKYKLKRKNKSYAKISSYKGHGNKEYQEKKIMLNKNVINKIKNKLNYNQEKILGYLL